MISVPLPVGRSRHLTSGGTAANRSFHSLLSHRENEKPALHQYSLHSPAPSACSAAFTRASFGTNPKTNILHSEPMPDRRDAWELLCEYTKGDSLRKHALAVETAMRACAKRYGEADADEDEWGLVGLLHDFDYEMFPSADQHPFTGANILCGRGYSERFIRAIMGHATYTRVTRDTQMARALFATDELCGFLVACALVRPSRSLDDMEVASVKKKLKDKAFARSVNREDIRQGVEELGVDMDEHIRFVIDALRPAQKEIGLTRIATGSDAPVRNP